MVPKSMPRNAAPPVPSASEPQEKRPVVASQLSVSPAASQSPRMPPATAGSLKEEMDAKPSNSKFAEMDTPPPSATVNTRVVLSYSWKISAVVAPFEPARAAWVSRPAHVAVNGVSTPLPPVCPLTSRTPNTPNEAPVAACIVDTPRTPAVSSAAFALNLLIRP